MTPGAGPFLAQGPNPQGNATYQISWQRANGFRKEDFFMFLPILDYVKHVTPGAGSFLAPGA